MDVLGGVRPVASATATRSSLPRQVVASNASMSMSIARSTFDRGTRAPQQQVAHKQDSVEDHPWRVEGDILAMRYMRYMPSCVHLKR